MYGLRIEALLIHRAPILRDEDHGQIKINIVVIVKGQFHKLEHILQGRHSGDAHYIEIPNVLSCPVGAKAHLSHSLTVIPKPKAAPKARFSVSSHSSWSFAGAGKDKVIVVTITNTG